MNKLCLDTYRLVTDMETEILLNTSMLGIKLRKLLYREIQVKLIEVQTLGSELEQELLKDLYE
jgi:hypothetical protein